MTRSLGLAVAAIILGGMFGCAGNGSRWPNIFHPGPTAEQQNKSVRFDPYPQTDMGPALVGARPRDYDKAIPETDRARWQRSTAPYPSAFRP